MSIAYGKIFCSWFVPVLFLPFMVCSRFVLVCSPFVPVLSLPFLFCSLFVLVLFLFFGTYGEQKVNIWGTKGEQYGDSGIECQPLSLFYFIRPPLPKQLAKLHHLYHQLIYQESPFLSNFHVRNHTKPQTP